MDNKEILQKVFEKVKHIDEQQYTFLLDCLNDNYEIKKFYLIEIDGWEIIHLRNIFFSHKFAKAFWGESILCSHCKGESKNWIEGTCPKCFCNNKYKMDWQYHLQQMVIEEEPIKYLEKFL